MRQPPSLPRTARHGEKVFPPQARAAAHRAVHASAARLPSPATPSAIFASPSLVRQFPARLSPPLPDGCQFRPLLDKSARRSAGIAPPPAGTLGRTPRARLAAAPLPRTPDWRPPWHRADRNIREGSPQSAYRLLDALHTSKLCIARKQPVLDQLAPHFREASI